MKPSSTSFCNLFINAAFSLSLGGLCLAAPRVLAQEADFAAPQSGELPVDGESASSQAAELVAAPALQALWAAGGETDFSQEAWSGRVGVSLDRWDNVPGSKVSDLTGGAAFYGPSAQSARQESFAYDPEQAVANGGNGVRLRGILVIPEDGEYSFALAGDDAADLYLGEPGGSRFTKKKALSVPSWINYRDWSRYRTAARAYKAGEVLWVEVLGKNTQGVGGLEHFSVAWKRPGETAYSLIPGKLEDGRIVLSTPPVDPEDAHDIGVPQSWLSSVGLGGASPVNDPRVRLYGDTDGDGFNLLEEYLTGGRPDEAGGNTGYFQVEKWTGVSGGSVEAFTKSDRFLQAPNETRRQEGALDLADSGDNYFIRLRAIVTPPLSGEWTFYVAGDDSARLLLSKDGKRFLKRPVAQVNSWTNRYQWNKEAGQKSDPQVLQAGVPYFLEGLQYQIGGGAHIGVAWQLKAPNLCRMEGATATQSSTYGGSSAGNAIDGEMNTQSHTNWTNDNSWWQVSFPLPQAMNQVVIYNRTDGNNGRRLSNFRLSVLDASGKEVAGQDFYTQSGTYAGAKVVWDLPETVQGVTVKIQGLGLNANGDKYLCLKEVEVYEHNEYTKAPVLVSGAHVQTIPAEPNDADNNSLPDDWQAEKGLVAGQNGLSAKDCSEYGDPDGDLVPNFAEHLLGSNPLVPGGAPGYLTQEMWWNVAGWSVDDAMKSADVLGRSPVRTLLKGGQPGRNVGENYFRRLRGTIKVPVTGDYTFWISSDETSVLYLSTDDRKFNKKEIARVGYGAGDRGVYLAAPGQWDAFPKQRSAPVRLEEGKEYFIEVNHKQYHAIDHVQLAWQIPGGQRELIPGEAFTSFGGDLADRDDDDLPDEWETRYGIKADDNGAGDFNNGAWGDPYGTGITNREAYLNGWSPQNPPSVEQGTPVVTVPGNTGNMSGSDWVSVGDSALSTYGRGTVSYTITLPEDGRYLLELSGKPTGNVLETETMSIAVKFDNLSLGGVTLTSIRGRGAKSTLLLPLATSGTHTVTLTLCNTDLRRSFSVDGVRVIRPEGEDTGNHGMPDWLYNELRKTNGWTNCPPLSLTSPACVEGRARVLDLTNLTRNGEVQTISPGTGKGWYANINLPENGAGVELKAAFESGAAPESRTIQWAPCNMLVYSGYELRQGDALRVTVADESIPEGTQVTYTRNGTALGAAPSGTPVVCRFDTAGEHVVKAVWTVEGAEQSATMTVGARAVDLGSTSDLYTNRSRYFTFSGLPANVVFQTDAPLHTISSEVLAADRKKVLLISAEGGNQYMVARLGESGPIMAVKELRCHAVASTSALSNIEVVEKYEDGSQLARMFLSAYSLPPGGYIEIKLVAGGVQFLEGGTVRRLYAEDFDENGLACIFMTLPNGTVTSACHQISYYDSKGNRY